MRRIPDHTLRRLGLALFALIAVLDVAYVMVMRGLDDQPQLTYELFVDRADMLGTLATGAIGATLTWLRPRNRIGWLLTVSGLCLATTMFGQAYGARAVVLDEWLPLGTLVLSLSAGLWIPAVFIPASLVLVRYPSGTLDGRWPLRFERTAIVGLGIAYVGYAMAPEGVTDVVRDERSIITGPSWLGGPLLLGGIIMTALASLVIVLDAVRRVRRGPERERKALLLVLASTVAAVVVIMVGPDEDLGTIAYSCVLATIALGVLRYGALGIEVSVHVGGDRNDPFAALSRLGSPLGGDMDERSLTGVLEALRDALGVDGVAVEGAVTAVSGTLPAAPVRLPLQFAGSEVGILLVGERPGGTTLGRSGQRVLEAVAPLIAAVLHAVQVAEELRGQQERVVAATQAERVRLRQELHDGLGPALTGIGLSLEALAGRVPTGSEELVTRLRTEVAGSLEETRRIIDDLRPSALDDGDLASALRRRADQFRSSGLRVDVQIDDDLPPLPAAVAAATFRIAEEAMTNVIRHSGGSRLRLALQVAGDAVVLEVEDDGRGPGSQREGGVGISSMRDRAERLGGTFEIGPADPGTRVRVSLPLAVAS